MKAVGKYVVIKTIEEEVKTDSGLILSGEDVDKLRYRKGIVIAGGSASDKEGIKNGDSIYYDKSSSFTMLIEDVKHTIIRLDDVVVVL